MLDTLRRLSPDEAAEIWNVDRKIIYNLLKTKKLRGAKIGGQWRIPQEAIPEYEAAAQKAAPSPAPATGRRIVTRIT